MRMMIRFTVEAEVEAETRVGVEQRASEIEDALIDATQRLAPEGGQVLREPNAEPRVAN